MTDSTISGCRAKRGGLPRVRALAVVTLHRAEWMGATGGLLVRETAMTTAAAKLPLRATCPLPSPRGRWHMREIVTILNFTSQCLPSQSLLPLKKLSPESQKVVRSSYCARERNARKRSAA